MKIKEVIGPYSQLDHVLERLEAVEGIVFELAKQHAKSDVFISLWRISARSATPTKGATLSAAGNVAGQIRTNVQRLRAAERSKGG